MDGFSLIADSSYISASLGRIMRALFEICLRRSWVSMTALLLDYCKAVDRRVWPHQHPLRQFDSILSPDVRCFFWLHLMKSMSYKLAISLDGLCQKDNLSDFDNNQNQ